MSVGFIDGSLVARPHPASACSLTGLGDGGSSICSHLLLSLIILRSFAGHGVLSSGWGGLGFLVDEVDCVAHRTLPPQQGEATCVVSTLLIVIILGKPPALPEVSDFLSPGGRGLR